MRVAAVFFCAIATVLAITVQSIYGLLHMCGDVVYVVLFPQLVCVMFVPWFNTFGSLIGESNISFFPHGGRASIAFCRIATNSGFIQITMKI